MRIESIIMEILSLTERPLKVSEIASMTGMTDSHVRNTLKSLERYDFVQRGMMYDMGLGKDVTIWMVRA